MIELDNVCERRRCQRTVTFRELGNPTARSLTFESDSKVFATRAPHTVTDTSTVPSDTVHLVGEDADILLWPDENHCMSRRIRFRESSAY